MAGEPVSRILYGAALADLLRDDHSSSPGLAAGIQRPTRGFILPCRLRCTKGSSFLQTNSVSRASSPLLFGLAPRGVCLASAIADGAVGSYPTFSPLPSSRSIRRHPEGFPPGYHRDTLRWRYILCGTIRDAAASSRIPWRYQARCPSPTEPCGSKITPPLSRSGVRTFLPPSRLREPGQRSSGSPASFIITRDTFPALRLFLARDEHRIVSCTSAKPRTFSFSKQHNKPRWKAFHFPILRNE